MSLPYLSKTPEIGTLQGKYSLNIYKNSRLLSVNFLKARSRYCIANLNGSTVAKKLAIVIV
jgi:hypothetical protein